MKFETNEEFREACQKVIDIRHNEAKWFITKLDNEERSWILKNSETEEWTFIEIGDILEIITIEESFNQVDASYQGSIKTTVVDLSNKDMVRVRLPNTKGHLLCEGDKVFSVGKTLSLQEGGANVTNLTIIVTCMLVIAILLGIIFI